MAEKEIFTSVVRVKGSEKFKVVPVKSSDIVDKALWIEISKVLSRIYASVPIERENVICKNVLNTGIDILCTRDIDSV